MCQSVARLARLVIVGGTKKIRKKFIVRRKKLIAWLAIVDACYISNGTTKHCTGFVGNFGAIFGPCTITVRNWNISSIKLQQEKKRKEKKRKEKNCIRKEKKSALYI